VVARSVFQEAKNVEQLYDEMRHAGPMPDVPLIVLCSMGTDGFKQAVLVGESEALLREEIEVKRRLYATLAKSVPRGENRLIDAGQVTMHLRSRTYSAEIKDYPIPPGPTSAMSSQTACQRSSPSPAIPTRSGSSRAAWRREEGKCSGIRPLSDQIPHSVARRRRAQVVISYEVSRSGSSAGRSSQR
jgi:hypothetical protein